MHRLLTYASVFAVLIFAAPGAAAQEAEPLHKSDIIRLLTGTTYTKAEVAGIIRQSCLSFTPTDRDRTDFRALGADDAVMTAIEGCVRPRAATPALQLDMGRRIFDVRAGDTLRVPVAVNRGSAGEGGVRLRLAGSGALSDGPDATATTDANGRATFVVPAGIRSGSYNLTVDANVPIGGSRAVTVRVEPPSPTRATANPDPVVLSLDEDAPVSLRVTVLDRYGNAIPGIPVEVRIGSENGTALTSGRTSSGGSMDVPVVASLIGGANRLVIISDGVVLGSAGVVRPAGAVVDLAAVSGDEQTAEASQALPLPLVVVVTDVNGVPEPHVEVRFSAENGQVRPEAALTDAEGRASTIVTVGASGDETTVSVTAGDVSRGFTFPITRGGMTAAAIEATLLQAAGLLETGETARARELYLRVAAADGSNLTAAMGVADTYAAEGQYAEAVERYRAVLRMEPSRRDAQVGMARASFGAGNYMEAERWFDLALTRDQNDVDSWVGLGDSRARLGEKDEARAAYSRALSIDPSSAAALRALGRLGESPLLLEGDLWGGYTDDNGRDPGFRWAELRVYPGAGLDLWFAYDNALNFRHPYLVRGEDDIEGTYGGVGYGYGAGQAYRTSFEFGRRKEPVDGTIQTTWMLDQTFGLSSGGWFKLGGWLGHWYDRDDWVVFAQGSVPAGASVVVKPMASYGDYFGSGLTGVPEGVPNRAPAKEIRVGLTTRFETGSGLGVEPGVFFGNVDSDASDELSGSLWDASMRLWYAVSQTFAVDSFVQYQSPPGLPSFWRIGLGLRFGVRRSN